MRSARARAGESRRQGSLTSAQQLLLGWAPLKRAKEGRAARKGLMRVAAGAGRALPQLAHTRAHFAANCWQAAMKSASSRSETSVPAVLSTESSTMLQVAIEQVVSAACAAYTASLWELMCTQLAVLGLTVHCTQKFARALQLAVQVRAANTAV